MPTTFRATFARSFGHLLLVSLVLGCALFIHTTAAPTVRSDATNGVVECWDGMQVTTVQAGDCQ